MKRVLFIPTHHYLSKGLYEVLADGMKGKFETHLLDTQDPALLASNAGQTGADYRHFDFLHQVPVAPPPHITGYAIIFQFHRWAAGLKTMIRKIRPDVIICESDNLPSTRILDRHFPNIPLVIIQGALLNNDPAKYVTIQRSFLKKLFRPVFAAIIDPIRSQPHFFGLDHARHHVFVFGERTKRVYGDQLPKHLYLVGYPLIKKIPAQGGDCITVLMPVEARPADNLQNFDDYLRLAQAFPTENFIFKPHPRSDWNYLEGQLKELQLENVQLDLGQDFHGLMQKTKLCISSFSFADFHFIAAEIPMIRHRRQDFPFFKTWFDDPAIPRTREAEALIQVVKQALNAPPIPAQDKYLTDFFSHLGQDSINATLAALDDVLATAL